jgi:beta-glucosidase
MAAKMTTMTQTTAVDHEAEIAGRLAQLSLEEKVRLMTGADIWALHPIPEIGLRRLVTSDGPAGVRGETWDERSPSGQRALPYRLAASWDPVRVERRGLLLAARRAGRALTSCWPQQSTCTGLRTAVGISSVSARIPS